MKFELLGDQSRLERSLQVDLDERRNELRVTHVKFISLDDRMTERAFEAIMRDLLGSGLDVIRAEDNLPDGPHVRYSVDISFGGQSTSLKQNILIQRLPEPALRLMQALGVGGEPGVSFLAAMSGRSLREVTELRAEVAMLERRLDEPMPDLACPELPRASSVEPAVEPEAASTARTSARIFEEELSSARAARDEAQREVQLLRSQVEAMRTQLASLQVLLDESSARDAESQVQIETLGAQLNMALARAAASERDRAKLAEQEARRAVEAAKQECLDLRWTNPEWSATAK